jgi:hypothetical protein
VIYQVVTEPQPFPERAVNLAEVDVVRTAGAERWHTLYQELTLCVWVVFPVDVPDALQRLHDCGPMLVSRANQDIDDRFCGYTRNGSTTKMLDDQWHGCVHAMPNGTSLVYELVSPARVVGLNRDGIFRTITPSTFFVPRDTSDITSTAPGHNDFRWVG